MEVRKFKVGDRVQCIKSTVPSYDGQFVGRSGIITKDYKDYEGDEYPYSVRFDDGGDSAFCDEELALDSITVFNNFVDEYYKLK